jgi:phosphoribosylamine---glycine ligase
MAECIGVDPGDIQALAALAGRLKPDLTVVGPELPLVRGLADEFDNRGLKLIGPTKSAAELEGSKIFAKQFLQRHGIPTASAYGVFNSSVDAYTSLCAVDWPVVLKANGLCGGKGVLVTSSPDAATSFIGRLMEEMEFGDAGKRLLIEEGLEGEELSYIVLTDGASLVPMAVSRDHKRTFDGNEGPNTGGMGAYSMDALLPPELEKTIRRTIVEPTIRGMASEGRPYKGFLYFGLMLTSDGPKVLEFNCRMGDPETQAIVMRMAFDLAEMLMAAADGKLGHVKARWAPAASACVVLASKGYPGTCETGKSISGLSEANNVQGAVIFHAATKREGSTYYTSGGRVLGVAAGGSSLRAAVATAYEAAGKISFEGMHYRRDIGRVGPVQGRAVSGAEIGNR